MAGRGIDGARRTPCLGPVVRAGRDDRPAGGGGRGEGIGPRCPGAPGAGRGAVLAEARPGGAAGAAGPCARRGGRPVPGGGHVAARPGRRHGDVRRPVRARAGVRRARPGVLVPDLRPLLARPLHVGRAGPARGEVQPGAGGVDRGHREDGARPRGARRRADRRERARLRPRQRLRRRREDRAWRRVPRAALAPALGAGAHRLPRDRGPALPTGEKLRPRPGRARERGGGDPLDRAGGPRALLPPGRAPRPRPDGPAGADRRGVPAVERALDVRRPVRPAHRVAGQPRASGGRSRAGTPPSRRTGPPKRAPSSRTFSPGRCRTGCCRAAVLSAT